MLAQKNQRTQAMGTRLNKFLAQSGLGSRRAVEELVTSGRITVNGRKTARLGTVIEEGDRVELDGKPVAHQHHRYYLMLNKPRGYITTAKDEKNRPTVMDLLPEKYRRHGVFPVGRLDRETSGLLLLTSDGDLAYRLTKPDFHVPKEYMVDIDRSLEPADMSRLSKGVYIHQLEIKTRPAHIECVDETCLRVKIVITEGKNRQIRYMLLNLGYRVKGLERTAYGPLTMRRLKKGTFRELAREELRQLKNIAGL
jgi:23S rRNA pseudouridine2605 synthase